MAACLASCDRKPATHQSSTAPVAATARFAPTPPQAPGVHLAYIHDIGLELPEAVLAAHFDAARDRCLTSPALHCLLLGAELSLPRAQGDTFAPMAHASLKLRLPHDQVAPFANALTEPLPGEAPGLVQVARQSTTAEDLGRPIADVTQRVAQLRTYLESLKALEGRLTISVSDLVKIANETTQAQTQIEAALAAQRDLSLRVDTEELDVDFAPLRKPPVPVDPIERVRADSETILRDNLADMARFSIAAAAWSPVGLVGLGLVRLALGRRRK